MQIKADLHVHTTFSKDSIITPKELILYAKQVGLNAVAVTDHNSLEGAFKIAKENDFLVIPGMEVSSIHGHIVALNVAERVPRDLSADDTVECIHKAGGIAIACHPFAWLKGSVGKYVTAKFDAVEAVNASAFPFGIASKKAVELAERLKLPSVAGTDAHYGPVIGCAYTLMEAEPNVEAVIEAITKGRCEPRGGCIPLNLRIENQGRFLRRLFANRGQRAS
jgi:predicted metal-dependent phosphoesterase TrpH